MGSTITTELVPLARIGPSDRAAWSALAARAVEPNPYFEAECVLPAAAHLHRGDRAELVVVRRGRRWLACVPVLRRAKWSDLYAPCLRTWNHAYCMCGTPLVDREAVADGVRGLLAAPGAARGRAFLALEGMADGPVAEAVLAARTAGGHGSVVHGGFRRAVLRRRPEDTYVLEAANGKRRRELARTRRVLERDVGGPALLVDATAEHGALERFLTMEAAGWKREAGTAFLSVPGDARFVRKLWDGFAAVGRVHLLELRAGPRVLAAVLCLSAGDELHSCKLTHDETLRRGTPGVHLMAEAASWFHTQPHLKLFDSDAEGDNPMINALWPDRRQFVTPVVPAAGVAGLIAHGWLEVHAHRRRGATTPGRAGRRRRVRT